MTAQTPKLTKPQELAKAQIDRIASTLAALGRALDQERADLGCADYGTVDVLAYVVFQLENVEDFWTQSGPEYTE